MIRKCFQFHFSIEVNFISVFYSLFSIIYKFEIDQYERSQTILLFVSFSLFLVIEIKSNKRPFYKD